MTKKIKNCSLSKPQNYFDSKAKNFLLPDNRSPKCLIWLSKITKLFCFELPLSSKYSVKIAALSRVRLNFDKRSQKCPDT